MFRDLANALRNLARNPTLSIAAVLTLALGIGANTAMFSIVDAVLLRPLPYRDPGRLVTIRAQIPTRNIYGAFVEYNTFGEWWRARSHSFESLSAFTPGSANLTVAGEPERLATCRVNAGFLALIGIRPALGRDFLPAEDQPGAPRVAILSDALWQRRFAADPGIFGHPIVLDQNPYAVVGVLPPGFDLYGSDVGVFLPIAASTARVPGMPSVGVFGRLKPGVPLRAAQAEIDDLCRGWVAQYRYPSDWGAHVWTVRDFMIRDVRSSVWMLSIAVGLVLLIACANVANLLLARAATRQREIAIRAALGASRTRILSQLLIESAVLAVLAAALGLAAAWGSVRIMAAASPYLPLQKTVAIDLPVLLFTAAAAVVTTLLFGLAPALAAVRTRLAESARTGEGAARSRFRAGLVIVEVALSVLLTIGATLTARSLLRLQAVDPGFRADGVLTGSLTIPRTVTGAPQSQNDGTNPISGPAVNSDPARRVHLIKNLAASLARIPGVRAAGLVSHLPFSNAKSGSGIVVEGAPPPRPGEKLIVFQRTVESGYFPAIGARLLRGRLFDDHDPPGHPVAIVNETVVRRCWPREDPIGKRFGDGQPNHWLTVVGVIADMRQTSLADEPDAESYVPYAQSPDFTMALVVRTSGDPLHLSGSVRAAVREVDSDLPISGVAALTDSLDRSTRSRRFSAAVLGAFAFLALLLAALGIYGVISYSVTRRTQEIGVRMALGADPGRIEWFVAGRALALAGWGVLLGWVGALALTRLLRSLLFGVSPTDPAVFIAASLFLLAAAALAGFIPARRAARTDPLLALRHE